MKLTNQQVSSQHLGHLGLIAGVIHELGIIEKIDARLPLSTDKGGIVSYGRRVAAMLLNGLGFMNSRLYMTTHYFEDKPLSELLRVDITPAQLNDDCLGRCLDKINEYGVTQLFSEIAFEIAAEKGLLGRRLHLDSTSFSLEGRYDVEVGDNEPLPTYGYSKDHRPDLKQVMLSLTQGGVANLPLWMEAQNGNTSDQKSFQDTVRKVQSFMKELESAPDDLCFVVDAAFYTPEKLAELNDVRWITRVPAKLNEAKACLSTASTALAWETVDDNYKLTCQEATISGLQQRWIMVHSEHAKKRELKSFQRRLDKQFASLSKEMWHLSNQIYNCKTDAEKSLKPILKKAKHHLIEYTIVPVEKHKGRGRPSSSSEKQTIGWRIDYSIASHINLIQKTKDCLGRFILATNQVDQAETSHAEVLKQYKEQSSVEAGFKFIKDQAFELDSFYLKNPGRIGSLMMIMTLCLMVYNFGQYHLRKCLDDNDDALPNQLGKPVKNPTMKWIAELMCHIAVVTIDVDDNKQRFITNVNAIHKRIIAYFGPSTLRLYGLPIDYKPENIDSRNYKKLADWCGT